MELRAELIREWKEGESVTALAEAYGVSRKTIYKWLGRHESEGTAGWQIAAARPITAAEVSAEMIAHIIETRQHWAGPAQTARQNGRGLAGGKDPIGQHGGRGIARQRPESCAQAPATDATLRGAICGCCAMQPNLVRGLQRLVPHEGWNALRSADHHRCVQPFSVVLPDRGQG